MQDCKNILWWIHNIGPKKGRYNIRCNWKTICSYRNTMGMLYLIKLWIKILYLPFKGPCYKKRNRNKKFWKLKNQKKIEKLKNEKGFDWKLAMKDYYEWALHYKLQYCHGYVTMIWNFSRNRKNIYIFLSYFLIILHCKCRKLTLIEFFLSFSCYLDSEMIFRK